MKNAVRIIVACLFASVASAPAFAEKWTVGAGWGGARLRAGQNSAPFIAPKNVSGDVSYFRFSTGYEVVEKFVVETSYFSFSQMQTTHALDYSNGTPQVTPNNRYHRGVDAVSVGPVMSLPFLGGLDLDLGAAFLFSNLRTTIDGGQEGPRRIRSNAVFGYTLSGGVSLTVAQSLTVGAVARYMNFGDTIVSTDRLTSGQGEVFVMLRF